jgi:hypothetical protein
MKLYNGLRRIVFEDETNSRNNPAINPHIKRFPAFLVWLLGAILMVLLACRTATAAPVVPTGIDLPSQRRSESIRAHQRAAWIPRGVN